MPETNSKEYVQSEDWSNFNLPLTAKNILSTTEEKDFVVVNVYVPSFFDNSPSFVNIAFSKKSFFEGEIKGSVADKTQQVVSKRVEDNKKVPVDFTKLSGVSKDELDSIPVCLNASIHNEAAANWTPKVYVSKKDKKNDDGSLVWGESVEKTLKIEEFKKLLSSISFNQNKMFKTKEFVKTQDIELNEKTNENGKAR